jgi:hypothetical protein
LNERINEPARPEADNQHVFDIHPLLVWRELSRLDKVVIIAFVLVIVMFGGLLIHLVDSAPFSVYGW